jgi:hypothetical protein
MTILTASFRLLLRNSSAAMKPKVGVSPNLPGGEMITVAIEDVRCLDLDPRETHSASGVLTCT